MLVIIFHLLKSVAKISFCYVTNQCENGTALFGAGNLLLLTHAGRNQAFWMLYSTLAFTQCRTPSAYLNSGFAFQPTNAIEKLSEL
jgi:hypothetical protein